MYVCVCACAGVCVCVCVCMCVYVCVASVHICELNLCKCAYVVILVYVYVYGCMCVCVHVCVGVWGWILTKINSLSKEATQCLCFHTHTQKKCTLPKIISSSTFYCTMLKMFLTTPVMKTPNKCMECTPINNTPNKCMEHTWRHWLTLWRSIKDVELWCLSWMNKRDDQGYKTFRIMKSLSGNIYMNGYQRHKKMRDSVGMV